MGSRSQRTRRGTDAGRGASPTRTRTRRPLASMLALLPTLLLACSKAPVGPDFEPGPPPAPHRARLYVYRADERISLATVRIELDGQSVGRLGHGEYETFELSAGPHRLRAGLRGPLLVAWGWNEHPLRLAPGETTFLRISVRLSEHATAPTAASESSTLEIAGRAQGVSSENVFIELRPESAALEELRSTTRRVP